MACGVAHSEAGTTRQWRAGELLLEEGDRGEHADAGQDTHHLLIKRRVWHQREGPIVADGVIIYTSSITHMEALKEVTTRTHLQLLATESLAAVSRHQNGPVLH
jgi:hypothetical protein